MSEDSGRVVVTQLGSRMHYAVPLILHHAGRLERLYTDFYWRWPQRTAFARRNRFLRRVVERQHPELELDKVRSFGPLGITYKLALDAAGDDERRRERVWVLWGRWFAARVARAGFGDARTVYAFKTAALETFRAAKGRGIKCCVEQIIAPRELEVALLAEEHRNWPGWEEAPAMEPTRQVVVRERAEWAMADTIVAGSEWVREGLVSLGVADEKIKVVAYGVDTSRYGAPAEPRRREGKLRILFAGAVGLRKGVPYLHTAVRHLRGRHATLDVAVKCAGSVRLAPEGVHNVRQTCELLGRVPKAELVELYRWADVFVLPSICEGSATVIYEALAAGLPVITTPNAGSIVRDGVDGFVVPAGDAEALADRIATFLRKPLLIGEMGQNAVERAAYGSLEAYGRRLLQVV